MGCGLDGCARWRKVTVTVTIELICGVKPYFDNNPFNAMLKMAQFTSPIEYADEEIKDLFYDKSNRNLLDFLQKCLDLKKINLEFGFYNFLNSPTKP